MIEKKRISSCSQKKLPPKSKILIFQEKLLKWYELNGRKFLWRSPSTSPYEKVIAELLLQRTKAESVNSFFSKFIEKYPSWVQLATAEQTEIESFLRPLGLSGRRSKSLHELSIVMVANNGLFPNDRKELEKLPGVGQYIASAIQLLIFNKPEPLLDINMQRVLERNFGSRIISDIRYDPYLQKLSRIIVSIDNPIKMNFAILDFSAIVCKARKPSCNGCIFSDNCLYFKSKTKIT